MLKRLFPFFVLVFFSLPVQATMFRSLNGQGYSVAASQYGAMAFKGTVNKIEDVNGDKRVTFLVLDVIKGNLKSGQTLVLNFPDPHAPNQLGYIRRLDIAPPLLKVGDTTVLFVSTNMFGKNFLLGGAHQGQFFVVKENGKDYLYNSVNNQNLLAQPTGTSNLLLHKITSDMVMRNSGTLSVEDLKALMNQ